MDKSKRVIYNCILKKKENLTKKDLSNYSENKKELNVVKDKAIIATSVVSVGIATGDLLANIEISKTLYPLVNGLYPVLKLNRSKDKTLGSYYISLEKVSPDKKSVNTLKAQVDFNKELAYLNRVILDKRRKGWNNKRINKYILNKYKIIIG